MADRNPIHARIADGVTSVAADAWDRCAGSVNPFLSHAFLGALEDSGSATAKTGWQSVPILIDGACGELVAAMPAYAKSHSQGEYVFDHAWADAWQRTGQDYYPKLQIAVPFTPATGPRLLTQESALKPALIAVAEALVREHELSSAHATFLTEEELPLFEAAGWLIRVDRQFHWTNHGYGSFADFLDALASRKRKAIRKEREAALQGLTVAHVSGNDLTEAHWDAFWRFYQDTGSRKWGRPYLTRRFFSMLGDRMADRVLLIFAYRDGKPIAGALNLIGEETLFGRYWGCTEHVPFLHFEICYYQAIDAAIARGLQRVEAGAQGEHKLARGYEPVPTWSAHYIPDPGFRRAVADFLEAERRAVAHHIDQLSDYTPFKKGG